MPNVTPYTGSAAGNGFPICLYSVDVSNRDFYMTLGGFKKGDGGPPTPEQISLSFQRAWRFYWMTYKIKVTEIFYDDGSEQQFTILREANAIDDPIFFNEAAEPIGRSCSESEFYGRAFGKETSDISGPTIIGNLRSSFFGTKFLDSTFYNYPGIGVVRMYVGSTSDPANFIGYGIDSPDSIFEYGDSVDTDVKGISVWGGTGTDVGNILLSIGIGSYFNVPGDFSVDGEILDIAYTSIEGIPVVGSSYSVGGALGSNVANATTLFAGADTEPTQSRDSKPFSLQIDSIEFYNQ